MRIAVFAAGAVGGYFGGRLAEAGQDVAFIARGENLRALREHGLRVDSVAGDFTIDPVQVTDDPAEIGPADAVLVAVKTWQLAEGAVAIRPLVGEATIVVPLLNGVEAPDVLADAVGAERVVGGIARIFAHRAGPGHVRHTGYDPTIDVGELDGTVSERVQRLVDVVGGAQGVTATAREEIRSAMWLKLLFVGPTGAVGAACRAPIGDVRSTPDSRKLLEDAMREVAAVARARGIPVPDGAVEGVMGVVDSLPAEEIASMHRDLVAGRPSELEGQVGVVVRLGQAAGVPTPVHRFLRAVLLPGESRARQERAAIGPERPAG